MSSFYLGWPIFDHKLSVFVNFGILCNFLIIYKSYGIEERSKNYSVENSQCHPFLPYASLLGLENHWLSGTDEVEFNIEPLRG